MPITNNTYYTFFPLFFLNELSNNVKLKIYEKAFGFSSSYPFKLFQQDLLETFSYEISSEIIPNNYFSTQANGEFNLGKHEFRVTKLDFETDCCNLQKAGCQYLDTRYCKSDISVWLSVDPMSDKRPGLTPYNYCQWSPVVRIDTNGILDDKYVFDEETIEYVTTGKEEGAHYGVFQIDAGEETRFEFNDPVNDPKYLDNYNFGNFLWGAGTSMLGIRPITAETLANAYAIMQYKQLDSTDDIQAIRDGIHYSRRYKK